MEKKELHAALILLMSKLESIERSPLKDDTFVTALKVVLKHFRDNGELKAAYGLRKEAFDNLKNSSWFATLKACLETPAKDGTQFPPIDMKKLEAELMSDEYVDNKIKEVLG